MNIHHTQTFPSGPPEDVTQLGHTFTQIFNIAIRNSTTDNAGKDIRRMNHNLVDIDFDEEFIDPLHLASQKQSTNRSDIVITDDAPPSHSRLCQLPACGTSQQFTDHTPLLTQIAVFTSKIGVGFQSTEPSNYMIESEIDLRRR